MTVDELRNALLGKTFASPVELASHMTVTDVDTFLKIQFIEVDLWKKEITKCPA
ncbi:DUF6965 family protein [Sphingobacterium haloxyli]|nr:hypothetical protein [Sphingobacterium haloxyli]